MTILKGISLPSVRQILVSLATMDVSTQIKEPQLFSFLKKLAGCPHDVENLHN